MRSLITADHTYSRTTYRVCNTKKRNFAFSSLILCRRNTSLSFLRPISNYMAISFSFLLHSSPSHPRFRSLPPLLSRLSFQEALINPPREPASNKFRLEREKQQIWVRWCQLRRTRATSCLSYFGGQAFAAATALWARILWPRTRVHTCVNMYVYKNVNARTREGFAVGI